MTRDEAISNIMAALAVLTAPPPLDEDKRFWEAVDRSVKSELDEVNIILCHSEEHPPLTFAVYGSPEGPERLFTLSDLLSEGGGADFETLPRFHAELLRLAEVLAEAMRKWED